MSCTDDTTLYVNGKAIVDAEFRNPANANALVDPTTVRFAAKDPNGTIEIYVYGTDSEVVKDAVGQYHCEIDLTAAGTWYWRAYSSGNYQGATEGSFEVEASNFV